MEDIEDMNYQKCAKNQKNVPNIQKINEQPNSSKSLSNKYALEFFQESKEELQERRKQAFQNIKSIGLKAQEISDKYYPYTIDMPKRPAWDFKMTKLMLERNEQRYFTVCIIIVLYSTKYIKSYIRCYPLIILYILQEYIENMKEILNNTSYFELNLETWRQLWRVIEMSDILLIIVDIRYPVLMFPPYLYNYVTKDLQKDMILILNKIDLAPAALVLAWKQYFYKQYPKLHVLMFTSYPTYNLHGNVNDEEQSIMSKHQRRKMKMAAEGAQKLLEICKDIVKDEVDLSSWNDKILEEMHLEYDLDDIDHKDNITIEKKDTTYVEHEKYKNGILTIGCIGAPNVGKSSLMNALMGKNIYNPQKILDLRIK
jgi:ribosome biogenesis GTPase A